MPDIGKLLWPRSVAVIGASSDIRGLRGRILEIMRGHPFAGPIYPVSRSETVVQGLAAFRAVDQLPAPADLAVLIIPARFVPQELERCGAAGIRAATILSSGFAEEPGGAGRALQDEVCAIARRYDMAVSGPNAEGFANTAAALCPTFSPVMEAGAIPLLPPDHRRGQVAVISQSGGMGFAFFDHGRPKHLSFRYIVTTGNEACLETFDFVDYMLDEGKTDAFLLLLEDVKNVATFERVAAKALQRRQAADRRQARTIGGRQPRRALAHRRAGRRASRLPRPARAPRRDRRTRHHRDGRHRAGVPGLRLPAAGRQACRHLHLLGRRRCLAADASVAAGLEVPELDTATRTLIDVHLPPYGTSQNPVDLTAQAVHRSGYAEFARIAAGSPAVDAVIVVISGRSPRLLMGDRDEADEARAQRPQSRSSCGAIPSRRWNAASS